MEQTKKFTYTDRPLEWPDWKDVEALSDLTIIENEAYRHEVNIKLVRLHQEKMTDPVKIARANRTIQHLQIMHFMAYAEAQRKDGK